MAGATDQAEELLEELCGYIGNADVHEASMVCREASWVRASDGRWRRFYGPEVHPTPATVLYTNMVNDQRNGTAKQLAYLRKLCQQRGITERDLIEIGIEEKRLHPDREKLLGPDSTGLLDVLTFGEIGGLFAFKAWLQGEF